MSKKNCACESFPCVPCIAGGGLVLGVILGLAFQVPFDRLAKAGAVIVTLSLWAIGAVAAYVLLSLFDIIRQKIALKADLLPADVEVADRSVAGEQAGALAGKSPLFISLRRLLQAWSLGASGPQIAAMARNQFQRADATRAAEAVTMLCLMLVSALPMFCRAMNMNFLSSVSYVNNMPQYPTPPFPYPVGLFVTGVLLATLLPFIFLCRRRIAAANAAYIEGSLLARIGNDTAAGAMQDYAGSLGEATAAAAESLSAAMEKSSGALAKLQEASAAQISAAQEKSIKQLNEAQDKVAQQLARVTDLAAQIDKVLQVQQTVEGTLKGVSSSEAFTSTLSELKRHLAESDELLKQVAKPRTIRLIENEVE